jgi:hypothetical protein
MDVAGRELKIWLDFESGYQFACPRCEKFSPVHDTMEKKWRHLDFWQHRTEFVARVPRSNCQEHGILQAAVPWARPGSEFTLMIEAMILLRGACHGQRAQYGSRRIRRSFGAPLVRSPRSNIRKAPVLFADPAS